jgi:hypothetical protein
MLPRDTQAMQIIPAFKPKWAVGSWWTLADFDSLTYTFRHDIQYPAIRYLGMQFVTHPYRALTKEPSSSLWHSWVIRQRKVT